MRICIYTTTALPKIGGQEMVVDALAREFLRTGHQVVVLAPLPRRRLRVDDSSRPYAVARHPRFYSTRRLVEWYRRWLVKLHRKHHFDVVHCHGVYPTGYLAALCRQQLACPLVITSHGDDVRPGSRKLTESRMRQRHVTAVSGSDALVSISRFTRNGYEQLCPSARDRIVDIPNGVDVELFSAPAPRPSEFDAAIQSGKYVLFLGRLDRRKGVDVLLEALRQLPDDGGVQLVIAGEGDERAELESQAARLGLAERTRFVGMTMGTAKAWLIQSARAVVLPSRVWEGLPLVVLEGYAAGTAVIGSDLPGLADIIEPERTGLVVAPESPEPLAAALRRALTEGDLFETMGRHARRVVQDYSWRQIAARHIELFERLGASPQQRRIA